MSEESKKMPEILKLGRWRLIASAIVALHVSRKQGSPTVSMEIILHNGVRIKENEADMDEAKAVVEAWGRYNCIGE